ncbi:hypothetical protein ND856_12880 [Leptospira bandrabouensis]|uniref:hypothetical protein n=1 Tax=Leptospira bandrabouensis TaxID=2484903 RepID=UPI00223E50DF|nr:hypothetical protein [Leptospira bandrabouensis]MCW7460346.1 hypothetical protein [Leptospira bandrabouensis]MCW7478179.1 hypothetical protein [Leptospira bandrabouensis]MCW7485699.1 hypothetical protein [Leptospira bandrabouensis]
MVISLKNCEDAYKDLDFDKEDFIYYTSPFVSQIGLAEELSLYKKFPQKLSIGFIIKQILKYYVRLVLFVVSYLVETTAYSISKIRNFHWDVKNNKTIFIDCYVLSSSVMSEKPLLEGYFPGLADLLEKLGYRFMILPRFVWKKNPFESFSIFRRIKKDKNNFLSIYQLLNIFDLLNSFFVCLYYPFIIWKMLSKLPKNITTKFLKIYFFKTLDGSNFLATLRYHFGLRLAQKIEGRFKVIQWFENQPYDKSINFAFNRNQEKSYVIGTQAFIWPSELLNYKISSFYGSKCLPSKILVSGPFYGAKPEFKYAPSLRYKKLFEIGILNQSESPGKILCIFSYFPTANTLITSFLKTVFKESDNLLFKFHPTTDVTKLTSEIPFSMNIAGNSIYEIFSQVSFVIGASSGALVEAIACGVPVIVISENGIIEYSYLPDFCKGVLWEDAYDFDSFESAKIKLINVIREESEQRLNMIQRVRSELFTEPTEERILEAFELS